MDMGMEPQLLIPGIEQGDEDEQEESPRRARPRTILLAVGVGLIATVCMVVFLISDRLNSFEGADRITELLDGANNVTGDEFEAVETKAGDLEDWFFLKHGLEHYAVPRQFANMKTVGCRTFKFSGITVAQIMAVADTSAQGRIVSVLEGGYDLEALAQSAAAHVTALMRG